MNIAKFWEDISNRKVLELSKIYSEEEAKRFQAIKDLLNTKKVSEDDFGAELHKKFERGVPKNGGKEKLNEISSRHRIEISVKPRNFNDNLFENSENVLQIINDKNIDEIEKVLPEIQKELKRIGWDLLDRSYLDAIIKYIENFNRENNIKARFDDTYRYFNRVTYTLYQKGSCIALPKYKNSVVGFRYHNLDKEDNDKEHSFKDRMKSVGGIYVLVREVPTTDKLVINRVMIAKVKVKSILSK